MLTLSLCVCVCFLYFLADEYKLSLTLGFLPLSLSLSPSLHPCCHFLFSLPPSPFFLSVPSFSSSLPFCTVIPSSSFPPALPVLFSPLCLSTSDPSSFIYFAYFALLSLSPFTFGHIFPVAPPLHHSSSSHISSYLSASLFHRPPPVGFDSLLHSSHLSCLHAALSFSLSLSCPFLPVAS